MDAAQTEKLKALALDEPAIGTPAGMSNYAKGYAAGRKKGNAERAQLELERDELRAEVERLRAELAAGAALARSITKEAFEEIAASWDDCEGEGCDDIGMALRHDFDRLAAPAVGTEKDAERFRLAIALEDNAETLYAAVMNNAPDVAEIRREFDAAISKAKEGA